MYKIYYAGKLSKMSQGSIRDHFTNKIMDLTFGWDFFCQHHNSLDLDETHTYVGTTDLETLEEIFHKFNMDIDEEFAEFIHESDATHTSMSVGDVLVSVETGKKFFCDRFGWTEV